MIELKLVNVIKTIQEVELFKFLPPNVIGEIASETKLLEMHANEYIFMEGDKGDGLYIIQTGIVEIRKGDKKIAEIKENDFFGELALIDNSLRTASAFAKTEGVLLFIDKETFTRIATNMPEVLRAALNVTMRYLRTNMEKSL